MSEEVKSHWFCFSYIGNNRHHGILGGSCYASAYSGYPKKMVTLSAIEENKHKAGVTAHAALLGVSYLGYMKKSSFNDED